MGDNGAPSSLHPDLTEGAFNQAAAIAKVRLLGEGKPPHSETLAEAGRRGGKG